MSSTFLSYSRKLYYFAESLALPLQQRGLSVWFDIQQLEPGVNWQADIEAGLRGCTSVTLVASRSALASTFVSKEWRHALENGKPIFVVLYERVHLPVELRQRALIVDCRSNFDWGVQSLIAQFQNPDRKYRPTTWLPRLPGSVRRMALALALHDLRHLMQYMLGFVLLTLVFSTAAWPRVVIDQLLGNRIDMPAVFGVFVAGLGLVTLVDYLRQPKQSFKALFFLNHNFDHNALVEQAQTVATWPQMLVGWGTLALSYVIFSTDLIDRSANWRNMVHSDLSREGLLLLLVAIFIVPLVNYLIPLVTPHLPDPDVVRWATPGNVSQEWRREVNRGLSTEWTPPSEQTVRQMATATVRYVPDSHASALLRTYQVIHAPGDEKTAKQVKIVLDRLRYQAVSSEATY